MARSEYEITHAAIRYATACMLDGNWHALREMGFGHRECDALQDLTLADLAALERRLSGHILKIELNQSCSGRPWPRSGASTATQTRVELIRRDARPRCCARCTAWATRNIPGFAAIMAFRRASAGRWSLIPTRPGPCPRSSTATRRCRHRRTGSPSQTSPEWRYARSGASTGAGRRRHRARPPVRQISGGGLNMGLPSEIDHSIDEAISTCGAPGLPPNPTSGRQTPMACSFSVNGTMPTPPCWYAIRS